MQPCQCYGCQIQALTDRLTDLWRAAEMDRLTEKLKAAGEVVARQAAKIEARADALIAREATIEARTDKSFVPHETVLDRTELDLDALYQKLALMSNHPLGESGDSSKAEEPPATQQPGSTASTEPGA